MAHVASWIIVVTINLCIFLHSSSPSFAARVGSSETTTNQHVSIEPLTNIKEETEIISRFCSKTQNSALCNAYGKFGQEVLMVDAKARKESLRLALSITNVAKETTISTLNSMQIESKYVPLISTCQASYNQLFSSFKSAWSSSSDLRNVVYHLKAASQSLDHCDDALAISGKDPSILNLKVMNKFLGKFVALSDVYSPMGNNN